MLRDSAFSYQWMVPAPKGSTLPVDCVEGNLYDVVSSGSNCLVDVRQVIGHHHSLCVENEGVGCQVHLGVLGCHGNEVSVRNDVGEAVQEGFFDDHGECSGLVRMDTSNSLKDNKGKEVTDGIRTEKAVYPGI